MSADLGFSDRVYRLGVGVFYVTYVLFEIPGAIIVERWSAWKWIAALWSPGDWLPFSQDSCAALESFMLPDFSWDWPKPASFPA